MDLDQKTYLSERVEPQIAYYEQAAGRVKRQHFRLQTAIIVLGVMVPALVNLPSLGPWTKAAVTAFSLLLPILSGLTNFWKYGELWLTYRTTEELLKNEKYFFLTGSGRYRDNPDVFREFVEAVESILSSEQGKFRAVFEQTRRSGPGSTRARDDDDEPARPGARNARAT